MVNAAATPSDPTSDRRERVRPGAAADAGVLGAAKLNPFGDLHTVQHLAARLARSFRTLWEPLLRRELRCWAEPLVVQRFADYRAERPDRLTAWLPLAMTPGHGAAWLVLDGGFALSLLDTFFGGAGVAPQPLPAAFTPSAEAMLARLATGVAETLGPAWEPLSRIAFSPVPLEASAATLPDIDLDDAVIATRFGLAATAPGADKKPVFVDILYPVAAMKPHGTALTGKVLDKAEPDPIWRNRLTRAVMGVSFPVRSVLAEPTVKLSTLAALRPGDVIPISFGPDVPVMVGRDRLGVGTVGVSNGRAAVRLTSLARDEGTPR